MLREVTVENFKRFPSLNLGMERLTVLTGLNSAGKSSVIQALLIADVAQRGSGEVPLNGPFGLSLGEASDVLNAGAAVSDEIRLRLISDEGVSEFTFAVSPERSVALQVADGRWTERPLIDTYLSAERLGPRDLLETSPRPSEPMAAGTGQPGHPHLVVGHRGQYTAHVLAQYDRRQIREALRWSGDAEADGAIAITLGAQTEQWLGSIVQPIRIQATWLPGTNAATLRFKGVDTAAEWMRPANVGFGVSYALPVVVAGLLAEPDQLMIVENPEAHLHPAAQATVGVFLAVVAASGVQVLVETHSEHVVNGMRRAVAAGMLDASETTIYFFEDDGVVQIAIQEAGALSSWPSGFFDQTERDLAALSRIKRPPSGASNAS